MIIKVLIGGVVILLEKKKKKLIGGVIIIREREGIIIREIERERERKVLKYRGDY